MATSDFMITTLVVVPTEVESRVLAPLLSDPLKRIGGALEICGFGPVAAAARTSQLLAALRPESVVLVGIAGAIDERLSVGTARAFQDVACHGIGVGDGGDHRGAGRLGWSHWIPSVPSLLVGHTGGDQAIGDVLTLGGDRPDAMHRQGMLLTCCSASNSRSEVGCRVAACPDAVAEDMEGFGAAVACRLHGVPLEIVRGISNRAGDRDKSNWRIDQALRAAAETVLRAFA